MATTSAPRKDHQSSLNRPSTDNRRYSELPYRLDMGFSAETLPLDLDYSALANRVYYSSPDLNLSGQTGVLGRSHLHGTSSGSGRSARLSIDDSNCRNSAWTAPTSPVNSDGMSSVYDCTAFDFPEPPPFGSPMIRRMRSSPWFLNSVNHVHDWRENVQPATLDDLSSRLRPSLCRLSTNKKPRFQADHKLPSTPTKSHNAEHLLAQRDSHRFNRGLGICGASNSTLRFGGEGPSPLKRTDSFLKDEKVTSRRDHPPLGRLPRIIRKVASMRSESQKANEAGYVRRSIPKIRSFRSILRAAEESTAPKTNLRRESCNQYPSWTREQSFATRGKVEKVGLTSNSKAAVGENKLLDAAPSSRALHPSLSHGVNWKSDFNTSFIDISPDRGPSKHKGKERMKSLLSRANEIFSWRKLRRK